jgi:hypothetical protein
MSKLTVEQKLQIPFPPEDIEWRVQSSGIANGNAWAMIMPYVTNRAIQERLDEVFGVFGWENEFVPVTNERGLSFLCGLTITDENGDKVTKWDGADETNFENFKGGLSNSMKRAGVQLGIGRYLYKLDTYFADLSEAKHKGTNMVKIKDGDKWERFYYNAPKLPEFALPENYEQPESPPKPEKSEPMEEAIESELGGRNFTKEADACKNNAELAVWWGNLASEYKKAGSPVITIKDARKLAIKAEQENDGKTAGQVASEQVQASKEVKEGQMDYSFESLKVKTVAVLKQIAKEFEITGFSKMDKPTLITSIIAKWESVGNK